LFLHDRVVDLDVAVDKGDPRRQAPAAIGLFE
jgi:hypothetical protein